MIKYFLISTLLFITLISHAQKIGDIMPIEDGLVTYTNVISVDSATKDELYIRAKKWFADNYKSLKDVIQFDDKESGEIIGKGKFNIVYGMRDPLIDHKISISVKDGKYKYILTNLKYSDNMGSQFNLENFPKGWFAEKKLYTTVDDSVIALIESLKTQMTTGKKDW